MVIMDHAKMEIWKNLTARVSVVQWSRFGNQSASMATAAGGMTAAMSLGRALQTAWFFGVAGICVGTIGYSLYQLCRIWKRKRDEGALPSNSIVFHPLGKFIK